MEIHKIIMFTGGVETLDYFSIRMAKEFKRMGYLIFLYDLKNAECAKRVRRFIRPNETILITFNFEGLEKEDGIYDLNRGYLWEQLGVPCFNIVADHPYFYHDRLSELPEKYYHISIDENHRSYLRKYYPEFMDAGFLPLAGTALCRKQQLQPITERTIDVLMTGNYTELSFFEQHINWINEEYAQFYRGIINDLIKEYEMTVEAMEERYCEKELGPTPKDELRSAFHKMMFIDLYVRNYYRGEVVKTLVNNGISVTVVGKGWEKLTCEHPEKLQMIPQTDSLHCLKLMQDAKIALNVMPWFKRGAHDRVFNGILQGAVSVSDPSEYLLKELGEGEGVVYYSLDNLKSLPETVNALLQQPERMQEIVDAGYDKVYQNHTWETRARELLEIVNNNIHTTAVK